MAKTLRQILDETSKKKMWIYAMDAKTEKDDIERRDIDGLGNSPKDKKTHEKRSKGLNYVAHKLSDVPMERGQRAFGKKSRYDEEKNFDDMDSDEQLKDLKRRTAEHKAGKPSSLKDIIKYTFKNGPDNIRRKQRNRKQGIDTAVDKLSGWK